VGKTVAEDIVLLSRSLPRACRFYSIIARF
jgi:hypothetical protein